MKKKKDKKTPLNLDGVKKENNLLLKEFPLLRVLNKGKENALNHKQLCKYFGFNRRELGHEVRRERLKGGFYLPENEEEFEAYIKTLSKRINATIQIKEAVEELKEIYC